MKKAKKNKWARPMLVILARDVQEAADSVLLVCKVQIQPHWLGPQERLGWCNSLQGLNPPWCNYCQYTSRT